MLARKNNIESGKKFVLREYQKRLFNETIKSLSSEVPTVLSAAPSSGKTFMASEVVNKYFKDGMRSLVLAHGTTVLKTQFYNSFLNYFPELSNEVCAVPSKQAKKHSVLIGIPQGIKGSVKDLGKIDLLVVDEAHEFFFADTVQKIVRALKPKAILCLTGTPSKFVYENKKCANSYNIVVLPLSEVPEENIADTKICVRPINSKISYSDFNDENDVNSKYSKDHSSNFVKECLSDVSHKMYPLLIAARDVKQAHVVRSTLANLGHKVGLSTAEDDFESVRIEQFKRGEIDILVVVRRGILGFDMPEMKTVIDMTLSRNINRMYQLFARVLRVSSTGIKKEFIKISPKSILGSYKLATNAMLHLGCREWISLYDGKSINDLNLIDFEGSGGGRSGGRGEYISLDNDPNTGLEVSLNFLKNQAKTGRFTVRISEVRKRIGEISRTMWTLDSCIEDAKKYSRKVDWHRSVNSGYHTASKNGWLEECCKHMNNRNSWTLENCKKIAKKFKTRTEWCKKSGSSYGTARNNGWLEQCCKHMTLLKKLSWSFEDCVLDAKKYKSRVEWQKNSSSAYRKALSSGWLEDCSQHMKAPPTKWTLDLLKKDAKKYKTKSEWEKNSSGAYNTAVQKKLLDECCKHMKSLRVRSYQKEDCIVIAKKFKTRASWKKASSPSYQAARVKGWLDECCKHMPPPKKPWTKDECKKEAKKYTQRTRWMEGSKGSYLAALRGGWLEECSAHMEYAFNWKRKEK